MKFFPTLIVSALALTLAAKAQSTGEAKAESKRGRTCRIVFPERPNDAPKIAYLYDGKTNQQVTLPSMNFSEVIALPPGDLTILMTAAQINDPKNIPPGLPMLKIPEAIRDFYILVTPDPLNSALPLRMNRVDTGGGKLKPGETLWFDLTDHRIVAKLGESRMSVNPKGSTVSASPVRKSGYYTAELGYQPKGEGEFQRITEQHWWHDTGSRHVGFVVNTGGKLPRIYYYRDFRLKDEEKTSAATE